ncbi:ATPase [Klebsiella pneumoniae subsp. pneumoniae]|nr:ATPase [Klebsiella pneumoniae subsp. pneumoniae]
MCAFVIFILFLHRTRGFLRNLCAVISILQVNRKHTRRWIVTTGVLTGVGLVFLLLAYLVYALIHAEAF